MKTIKKIKETFTKFWFIRIFKWLFRNRNLCPVCMRNPKDYENPEEICWDCYYKKLMEKK